MRKLILLRPQFSCEVVNKHDVNTLAAVRYHKVHDRWLGSILSIGKVGGPSAVGAHFKGSSGFSEVYLGAS